jgi:uncharacterized glyoxalase superfamily protein PhnB
MPVNYLPDGCPAVIPYLVVRNGKEFAEFMKAVFDATCDEWETNPDGTMAHGELKIGGSLIMFGETAPGRTPETAMLYVYVKDTDAVYKKAIVLGSTSIMAPSDQHWGDRNAGFKDKWGNTWWVATHVEDVPPDEMQRRSNERWYERQAKK